MYNDERSKRDNEKALTLIGVFCFFATIIFVFYKLITYKINIDDSTETIIIFGIGGISFLLIAKFVKIN